MTGHDSAAEELRRAAGFTPAGQRHRRAEPGGSLSPHMTAVARILWPTLGIVPFLSIYLAHYASPLGVPTGFIHGDMPYYAANGREIFERGNGLAHPNPYDPDPQAPVIYFHWLTWILGFGLKKLGLEPGLFFVGIGVIGSMLCSYLTLRLIEARLPKSRHRNVLFLFTI